MHGTGGQSRRRWWHRFGIGSRSVEWTDVELSDLAAITVGASMRGVGIDTAAFMWSEGKFAGACVYLTVDEARAFAIQLEQAIKDVETASYVVPPTKQAGGLSGWMGTRRLTLGPR